MQRSQLNNNSTDDAICFLCDYGWILLPILLLSALAYFFRDQWLPLVGITPAPTVAPTQTLGTGDVQATLTWSNTNDLDLWIEDPSGAIIYFEKPRSSSGGVLDVDANADCEGLTARPIENIFWPTNGAPRGQFKVMAQYFRQCEPNASIAYHVRLKVDGKVTEYDGTIQKQDDRQTVTTFTR